MKDTKTINVKFWRDEFILNLTPEEKFFYMYILTNPSTNSTGIYHLPKKLISFETGYNIETVDKLILRFVDYNKIKYDAVKSEITIKNWSKYNTPLKEKTKQEPKVIKLTPIPEPAIKDPRDMGLVQMVIRTFGRNPTTIELEYIQNEFVSKYGLEKVSRLFKEAGLLGFRNFVTLKNALIVDTAGGLSIRPKFSKTDTSQERTADNNSPKLKAMLEKAHNRTNNAT